MNIIDILTNAMEFERKSGERYRKYASEAEDTDSRILFEQLARDEESHFKQLQARLNAYKLLESQ